MARFFNEPRCIMWVPTYLQHGVLLLCSLTAFHSELTTIYFSGHCLFITLRLRQL